MKHLLAIFTLTMLFAFGYNDDLYMISLKSIEGKKISLSNFKGKKLLFITIPLSEQDTTLSMSDLTSLQTKYKSSLIIIGIPAMESGFKKGDEENIKKIYKNQSSNFLIAEGMKVKKAAKEDQSLLFQWLTDRNKNLHFNSDAQGVGSKFFVDEKGELYAVMGSKTKLSDSIIDTIIAR